MKLSKPLLGFLIILISAIKADLLTPKQYTIGLFCLAIDHEMERVIREKLKSESEDSPRYTELLKSLCRIPSTYMKFLNLRGIKFMPIFYNNNDVNVYMEQMNYIDGVLLIGGTVYTNYQTIQPINEKSDYRIFRLEPSTYNEYYEAVNRIVKKAKEINDGGRKFLILGICMGFEGLLMSETNFKPKLYFIKNNNYQRSINYQIPIVNNSMSKLKQFIGPENSKLFAENNAAYFFHNYGVSLENFITDPEIYNKFMPVATFQVDNTKQPIDFVAAYEHRKYPFFGLQFHPEKILFETNPAMKNLVKNDLTSQLSTLYIDFIYSELQNGAAGNPVPQDYIKKYSCPRYPFIDLLIFHEVYVYDCLNFLNRNWTFIPAVYK